MNAILIFEMQEPADCGLFFLWVGRDGIPLNVAVRIHPKLSILVRILEKYPSHLLASYRNDLCVHK